LTGSARLSQEAAERAEQASRDLDLKKRIRDLERRRKALEAQMAVMRADFEAEEEAVGRVVAEDRERLNLVESDRVAMARKRYADAAAPAGVNGGRA